MSIDIPARLEHIAAEMRKSRRRTPTQKMFDHILIAACDGWEHGDRALHLADRYAASGYPTGAQDEGRGKGTHGDPTFTAVVRPDPFAEVVARLKADVAQMDTAASGYRHQLRFVFERPEPKGRDTTVDVCAERHCGDPVTEPGRQGRCPACAKWIQRNRTPGNPWPPVPADVIDQRKIRRRREAA